MRLNTGKIKKGILNKWNYLGLFFSAGLILLVALPRIENRSNYYLNSKSNDFNLFLDFFSDFGINIIWFFVAGFFISYFFKSFTKFAEDYKNEDEKNNNIKEKFPIFTVLLFIVLFTVFEIKVKGDPSEIISIYNFIGGATLLIMIVLAVTFGWVWIPIILLILARLRRRFPFNHKKFRILSLLGSIGIGLFLSVLMFSFRDALSINTLFEATTLSVILVSMLFGWILTMILGSIWGTKNLYRLILILGVFSIIAFYGLLILEVPEQSTNFIGY